MPGLYPIGNTSFDIDWSDTSGTNGLPGSLIFQNPSLWSKVSDSITSGMGLSSGGLLCASAFSSDTYMSTVQSDGNLGCTMVSQDFFIDSTSANALGQFSLKFTFDQAYDDSAGSSSPWSMVHGLTWTLQEIARQANISNFTAVSVILENDVMPPILAPDGAFSRVTGLYTDRHYKFTILHWGNCFRIGIYDYDIINPSTGLKGGWLCTTYETPTGPGVFQSGGGVQTGSTWDLSGGNLWHFSGGTYTYYYDAQFRSAMEFQHRQFNYAFRMGTRFNTLSTKPDATHCKIYLGEHHWESYKEAWWPKNICGVQPSMMTNGISFPADKNTASWQGQQEGPPVTQTGANLTTIDFNVKRPINCTGVTYRVYRCPDFTNKSTDIQIASGTLSDSTQVFNVHDIGLTLATLYYYWIVCTGIDQLGITRTISYPLKAFRTKARLAQTTYINNDPSLVVTGDGSITTPFRSLDELSASTLWSSAGPDDVFVFETGHSRDTYSGTLTIMDPVGVADHPVRIIASNPAFPVNILQVGNQFGSGCCIQVINPRFVQFENVNATGPGMQPVGETGNPEQYGMTVVGAGDEATITSTANRGFLFTSTELTVLPSMEESAAPYGSGSVNNRHNTIIRVPRYNGMCKEQNVTPGYHGEDTMAHVCTGVKIYNSTIDRCFMAIGVTAIGTHENVNTTPSTGILVPYYEVNLRAGTEFIELYNVTYTNCVSMGVTIWADPFHRDPGSDGSGPLNDVNRTTGIDPVNDPWVFRKTDSGTDPLVLKLFGYKGVIIRADLFNAGPMVNYNSNKRGLLNLFDFNPLMPHRKAYCVNVQGHNVPGDCFLGTGQTLYNGTGLYGSGMGYKANPDGDTGYPWNVASIQDMLCKYITVSNSGRTNSGTGGPVGFLTTNCQGIWLECFFGFEARTRNGDGAIMDIDALSTNVYINRFITSQCPAGVCESSQNGDKNHNIVTRWNCGVGIDHQGGGLFFQALGTGGTNLMWNRVLKYDESTKSAFVSSQALAVVNSILTGTNTGAWDSVDHNNSDGLHKIWNSYLWNYGSGGIFTGNGPYGVPNIAKISCTIAEPGLPNLLTSPVGNPSIPSTVGILNYPKIDPLVSPYAPANITDYNWQWALSHVENWRPTTDLGNGIDPKLVGIHLYPDEQYDLTGAAIPSGNFPVGPVGVGVSTGITISPNGIPSGLLFGNAVISLVSSALSILPVGIVSTETWGNLTLLSSGTQSTIVYNAYLLEGVGTNWLSSTFSLVEEEGCIIYYQGIIDDTHAVLVIANIGDHNDGPYTISDGTVNDINLPEVISWNGSGTLVVVDPSSGGRNIE